jgi:hypothetical protein
MNAEKSSPTSKMKSKKVLIVILLIISCFVLWVGIDDALISHYCRPLDFGLANIVDQTSNDGPGLKGLACFISVPSYFRFYLFSHHIFPSW